MNPQKINVIGENFWRSEINYKNIWLTDMVFTIDAYEYYVWAAIEDFCKTKLEFKDYL